jgi:hypothetical protein
MRTGLLGMIISKPQRVVVALSCLTLAYCCLWIPWHVQRVSRYSSTYVRSGYGWLWTGPVQYCPPPPSDHTANLCDIVKPSGPDYDSDASPDIELMAMRFAAVTVVSIGAFLIAGVFRGD